MKEDFKRIAKLMGGGDDDDDMNSHGDRGEALRYERERSVEDVLRVARIAQGRERPDR